MPITKRFFMLKIEIELTTTDGASVERFKERFAAFCATFSDAYSVKVREGATIKGVTIREKRWFDKMNGNTYFSAKVYVTHIDSSVTELRLPYQDGYDSATQEVRAMLVNADIAPKDAPVLWKFCRENGIELHHTTENAKKVDVKRWGEY